MTKADKILAPAKLSEIGWPTQAPIGKYHTVGLTANQMHVGIMQAETARLTQDLVMLDRDAALKLARWIIDNVTVE